MDICSWSAGRNGDPILKDDGTSANPNCEVLSWGLTLSKCYCASIHSRFEDATIPYEQGGATQIGSKRVPDQTQKRPHFIQSVNRPSPATLHQRTRKTQPHFHVKGWAAGPWELKTFNE
jgi:hypothetical protein